MSRSQRVLVLCIMVAVACAPAFAATVKLKASNGQSIAVDSAGNTSLSSTAAPFTLVDGQCLMEEDSSTYSWTPNANATNAAIVIRHATNIGINWTGPTFSVTGGTGSGSTTPTVSFQTHLYPLITNSQKCGMCHPSTGINPQPPRPNDSSTTCDDSVGIPFNTTITAATMLERFKCMKARSTQGEYAQALGKVYVVPYQSAQSGLHHKAQASNASTFSENLAIGGVTKKVKEWITIWIDQGANP